MIVVHHLNNSRSQRILWLLEELGLDYEVVKHSRDPGTNLAPDSVRAVHPLGKLPVIRDGELLLAESGAIMEYVLQRYGEGRMVPAPGTPERLRYLYWMHYAEGSAMPLLTTKVLFDQIESAPVPFFVRPITKRLAQSVVRKLLMPQLARHLDLMEASLLEAPWFAGDAITAADLMLSFPLQGAAARAGLDGRWPHLREWLDRIEARPAYLRAIERGGPYRL